VETCVGETIGTVVGVGLAVSGIEGLGGAVIIEAAGGSAALPVQPAPITAMRRGRTGTIHLEG